MNTAPFKVTT